MNTPNDLNILWITERYPPLAGGMAVSAHRQVSFLRTRDIMVDVLVITNSDKKGLDLKRVSRDGGTDIFLTHGDDYGNAAQRAFRDIAGFHENKPYHMVLGFGANFPGYLAVTVAAFLGIPSLVSVRGNDFDRDWFEPKRAMFVQEALGRADRICAVSREKVRKIQALFPGKHVAWSPNGVDATRYELLPSEQDESSQIRARLNGQGKRIIGIFGEMKFKKQIPEFLAALREQGLKDKVSLLVTGRMDEECHALLGDQALSPTSCHLSFRDPETLPPLYGACDFVAIPSLFEGFPNVLLEAMAAGVIPIVSDAGAMGDVISHGATGFLFKRLNRKDSGKALVQALALSDEDLGQMKTRVKQVAIDQFSPEREGHVLENEIRNTVLGSLSRH
ncbi:MAG: glycosyltransferase family 4 protein [Proteobacteria bacterium]|nr:glycosyltransferase family 4 protein [Pseudomonadota bacterium]